MGYILIKKHQHTVILENAKRNYCELLIWLIMTKHISNQLHTE